MAVIHNESTQQLESLKVLLRKVTFTINITFILATPFLAKTRYLSYKPCITEIVCSFTLNFLEYFRFPFVIVFKDFFKASLQTLMNGTYKLIPQISCLSVLFVFLLCYFRFMFTIAMSGKERTHYETG